MIGFIIFAIVAVVPLVIGVSLNLDIIGYSVVYVAFIGIGIYVYTVYKGKMSVPVKKEYEKKWANIDDCFENCTMEEYLKYREFSNYIDDLKDLSVSDHIEKFIKFKRIEFIERIISSHINKEELEKIYTSLKEFNNNELIEKFAIKNIRNLYSDKNILEKIDIFLNQQKSTKIIHHLLKEESSQIKSLLEKKVIQRFGKLEKNENGAPTRLQTNEELYFNTSYLIKIMSSKNVDFDTSILAYKTINTRIQRYELVMRLFENKKSKEAEYIFENVDFDEDTYSDFLIGSIMDKNTKLMNKILERANESIKLNFFLYVMGNKIENFDILKVNKELGVFDELAKLCTEENLIKYDYRKPYEMSLTGINLNSFQYLETNQDMDKFFNKEEFNHKLPSMKEEKDIKEVIEFVIYLIRDKNFNRNDFVKHSIMNKNSKLFDRLIENDFDENLLVNTANVEDVYYLEEVLKRIKG